MFCPLKLIVKIFSNTKLDYFLLLLSFSKLIFLIISLVAKLRKCTGVSVSASRMLCAAINVDKPEPRIAYLNVWSTISFSTFSSFSFSDANIFSLLQYPWICGISDSVCDRRNYIIKPMPKLNWPLLIPTKISKILRVDNWKCAPAFLGKYCVELIGVEKNLLVSFAWFEKSYLSRSEGFRMLPKKMTRMWFP